MRNEPFSSGRPLASSGVTRSPSRRRGTVPPGRDGELSARPVSDGSEIIVPFGETRPGSVTPARAPATWLPVTSTGMFRIACSLFRSGSG